MPSSLLICIFAAVVIGIITFEILSLSHINDHIAFRCEANMSLAEPDEVITLSFRVRNTSFLPLMFVGFSVLLDDAAEIHEDEEWIKKYSHGGLFGNMFAFDFFLMPHRTYRGKLHFSFKERGVQRIGRIYLETGDYLGFKSRVDSFDIVKNKVVCTARYCDDAPEIMAMGGFLGDISVRRFICEDPSLVLGYREYTGTEPLKSVSWTQTAKTGRLMVKKHDFTVDTDVAVVFDIEQAEKAVAERCFSLLRTVCDVLEEAHIPYSVHSNGDVFDIEKGGGRQHKFAVHHRIGISRFIKLRRFSDLVDQCIHAGKGRKGCIVITPKLTKEISAGISRLDRASDVPTFVLTGELPVDTPAPGDNPSPGDKPASGLDGKGAAA